MYFTPVGGDILFVETSITPGKSGLVLTGQLGDVMKESARAALTYAKSNAKRFGISQQVLDDNEIHIHVPAGATPKEGPSAGTALATSLISALTGIPARADVAMSGEITLRGRVLRVGGIKEKAVAALRSGIDRVLLPRANETDLELLPEEVRQGLNFHPVETMDEVLDAALVRRPEAAGASAAHLMEGSVDPGVRISQ
jgi:ATP-dependent Lon protease